MPATLLVLVLALGIGAINLGSNTAFANLASSFIILCLTSYMIAVAANVIGGRSQLPRGVFAMPRRLGLFVNCAMLLISAVFIVFVLTIHPT